MTLSVKKWNASRLSWSNSAKSKKAYKKKPIELKKNANLKKKPIERQLKERQRKLPKSRS